MDIDESFKENIEIASKVIQAADVTDDVLLEVLDNCQDICAHRPSMLSIASNPKTTVLQDFLRFAPLSIRNDKELMLVAIQNDYYAFEHCSDELQRDKDIVMRAIPSMLYHVHDDFQQENPDVVIAAIELADKSDLWSVYDDVHYELWENRDVAKAWLTKGGDWLEDDFPESFCEDEELMLLVAKHNASELKNAHARLRADKDFMMKAVAEDGRLIKIVDDEELREDYELVLVAFAKDHRAIQYYSGAEDFEFIVEFARNVRSELEEHDTFVSHVLKPMASAIVSEGNHECPLAMLNQGPEMLKFYEETLSSYLDLAKDEELEELRRTSANLLAWGL